MYSIHPPSDKARGPLAAARCYSLVARPMTISSAGLAARFLWLTFRFLWPTFRFLWRTAAPMCPAQAAERKKQVRIQGGDAVGGRHLLGPNVDKKKFMVIIYKM